MKLSKKTDYALRAIFTLAESIGEHPVSIRVLAKTNDIPKRFLEHIMLEMKAKGWVRSVPGKEGGYHLAKRPEEITMGEIIRHFDGILAPIHCVSVTQYRACSQEAACRFRQMFLDARNYVARIMDSSTLQDVLTGRPSGQQAKGRAHGRAGVRR